MEMKTAARALTAIGNESRLLVYRMLIEAGPAGLPAGKLAELAGMPPSSLSFHLKELVHADLLEARHEGRFVIYAAKYQTMTDLIGFLTDNCCGGNPCMPVAAPCCDSESTSQD
ncbi:transcriptional regulator [Pigmentiphaga litoralis]|uniref:ArsR/SmtB family transcription factor n=1 Tax=Pigmentiphaga litoralis TaxID=516702 RepID=UPI001672C1D6|nr:metalloregulator ArsR/SmtB family transcription factor [Pigmentiphaga litoralis]GGX22729.1 transcriptional regulator [Pigmentiphaga litoralis]